MRCGLGGAHHGNVFLKWFVGTNWTRDAGIWQEYRHCAPGSECASLILLSRFSHLFFAPPKSHSSAAMRAQPNAVFCSATPYMVLYCLTPPRFHRYSSLTLCTPCPAWGEKSDGTYEACIVFSGGGICLVNGSSPPYARSKSPCFARMRNMPEVRVHDWQRATDNWLDS